VTFTETRRHDRIAVSGFKWGQLVGPARHTYKEKKTEVTHVRWFLPDGHITRRGLTQFT
jgi:hypothetical protein